MTVRQGGAPVTDGDLRWAACVAGLKSMQERFSSGLGANPFSLNDAKANAFQLRSAALFLRTAALAVGTAIALSACGHVLPDDPFDGDGQALSMVPVNHTDRYAVDIIVDKYWAGNVSRHAGGGSAACCYAGLKDWSQPVTVKWTWGTEEDRATKAITMLREPHTVVAHFPQGGPHDDPDPYKADAYLCVILRDLNTAELAFSPSASGCANK